MSYVRVTSIVPAADRDALRAMVEAIAAEEGIEGATGLWGVPIVSEADPETITHYGCFGWMDARLVDLLPTGIILPETSPELEVAP